MVVMSDDHAHLLQQGRQTQSQSPRLVSRRHFMRTDWHCNANRSEFTCGKRNVISGSQMWEI